MTTILGLLAAGIVGWLLFRTIRNNPSAFSKENMSKSLGTLGLLALFLLAVIFVGVSIIRG